LDSNGNCARAELLQCRHKGADVLLGQTVVDDCKKW
jgi:hypothetical protein